MKPCTVKLKGHQRYQRLLGGIPGTRGMRSGYVTLTPGESVGEHNTESKEEALIILSGKGTVVYGDGTSLHVEEDTLVYIPPHTKHDVKNRGTESLRYVYVVSPA
jgi:mannose-6-phosphate isomerase-like protein (cupin superfamily)